mmetsp:Transcript_14258/g.33146  ORF Transcript_14258/g.33146 Transcript_14258/m.33146 type:complete len:347 (+) Transcript_14258:104-1144(+)
MMKWHHHKVDHFLPLRHVSQEVFHNGQIQIDRRSLAVVDPVDQRQRLARRELQAAPELDDLRVLRMDVAREDQFGGQPFQPKGRLVRNGEKGVRVVVAETGVLVLVAIVGAVKVSDAQVFPVAGQVHHESIGSVHVTLFFVLVLAVVGFGQAATVCARFGGSGSGSSIELFVGFVDINVHYRDGIHPRQGLELIGVDVVDECHVSSTAQGFHLRCQKRDGQLLLLLVASSAGGGVGCPQGFGRVFGTVGTVGIARLFGVVHSIEMELVQNLFLVAKEFSLPIGHPDLALVGEQSGVVQCEGLELVLGLWRAAVSSTAIEGIDSGVDCRLLQCLKVSIEHKQDGTDR